MANIIISPGKYVQGAKELSNIGQYVESFSSNVFVIISKSGEKRVGEKVKNSLSNHGIACHFEIFNGECSKNEINRLSAIMKEKGSTAVIGIGGGKILDTAKAVAYYNGRTPVVICPTIASTDAPCSALSVIYTDDGVFEEYLFLPKNPDVVLVDTEVVAAAPARLLVSGMGDALATYFEARACQRSGAKSCAGGKITSAAMALAELCYNTLLKEGLKAKIAVDAGAVTESVEKIIEANTYLSGIGFESGGLAAAHAIHNGMTLLKDCHHLYHGEKVAFGTITQLMLENASMEELEEVIGFCIDVGLPVTFEDLGIKNVDSDQLFEVAKLANAEGDTIGNMPFEVTSEKVLSAMLSADAMGRFFKGE